MFCLTSSRGVHLKSVGVWRHLKGKKWEDSRLKKLFQGRSCWQRFDSLLDLPFCSSGRWTPFIYSHLPRMQHVSRLLQLAVVSRANVVTPELAVSLSCDETMKYHCKLSKFNRRWYCRDLQDTEEDRQSMYWSRAVTSNAATFTAVRFLPCFLRIVFADCITVVIEMSSRLSVVQYLHRTPHTWYELFGSCNQS